MSGAFSISRMVQFAETDMAGVMHFSNYFRLMEEVEHAFWRSLGMSVHFRDGDGSISWPRVRVACEYLAPAHFEDVLGLCLRVERIGEKSLALAVEFARGKERLATGTITCVCCRLSHGRFESVPIPAHVRVLLESFQRAQPLC